MSKLILSVAVALAAAVGVAAQNDVTGTWDFTVELDIGGTPENVRANQKAVGSRVTARCQELGLVVQPIGHMLAMYPPLIITREQIDELVGLLRKGIELGMDDVRKEGLLSG